MLSDDTLLFGGIFLMWVSSFYTRINVLIVNNNVQLSWNISDINFSKYLKNRISIFKFLSVIMCNLNNNSRFFFLMSIDSKICSFGFVPSRGNWDRLMWIVQVRLKEIELPHTLGEWQMWPHEFSSCYLGARSSFVKWALGRRDLGQCFNT